jgi:hypothetical protein
MSAKQTTTTTTTTTRKWKEKKNNTKKTGKSVAKAYSAELKKAKSSGKAKSSRRRCPTCGRPL